MLRDGVGYATDADPEGSVHMLAHAGRELSRAILSHLERDAGVVLVRDKTKQEKGDAHKGRIGAVLGLPIAHDRVVHWYTTHDVLVSAAHHRVGTGEPPNPDLVRDAFNDMTLILDSLVGRYFDTHQELVELAQIQEPTEIQVERAVERLLLPVHRQVFYSHLRSPHWLPHLVRRGQFSEVPDRIEHTEGWSALPWPERNYLIRIAQDVPDAVAGVFLAIPDKNTNPFVWSAAAEAARKMPGPIGSVLAIRIAKAIPGTPPMLVAHQCTPLVAALAQTHSDAAFVLAKSLLSLRKDDPLVAVLSDDDDLGRRVRLQRTDWMLQSMERHDLPEFASVAVPALTRAAPLRAVEMLSAKLALSDTVMRIRLGIERSDDHTSHYWCERLDDWKTAADHGDVRAILATTLWRSLKDGCLQDEGLFREALRELASRKGDIFRRIELSLLAAGPATEADISPIIADPRFVRPAFGSVEIQEFLQRRFHLATEAARRAFVDAVLLGPTTEEVILSVAGRRHWEAIRRQQEQYDRPETLADVSDPERQDVERSWQAARIAWFGDSIPSELIELAGSVGDDLIRAHKPDIESVHIRSSFGGRYNSADEPEELIQALEAVADEGIPDLLSKRLAATSGDEETQSLAVGVRAVEALCQRHPHRIAAVVAALADSPLHPAFLQAAISPLGVRAPESGLVIGAAHLSAMVAAVSACRRSLANNQNQDPSGADSWINVAIRTTGVLAEALRLNQVLRSETSLVADFIHEIVSLCSERWSYAGTPHTMDGRLQNLGTRVASSVVRLVAYARYWATLADDGSEAGAADDDGPLAVAGPLERLLECSGEDRGEVLGHIGEVLPFLAYTDPTWLTSTSRDLFPDSPPDTAIRGAMGSYVLHNRLYAPAFQLLRAEYESLARSLTDARKGSGIPEAELDRCAARLAEHVADAWVSGFIRTDGTDELARLSFGCAGTEAVQRVFWRIFRWLTDADEPVDVRLLERCIDLWRWRLDTLEGGGDPERIRAEASGLTWLITSKQLPVDAVFDFGRRTLRLRPTSIHTTLRLDELFDHDPMRTFEIAELIAESALTGRDHYVDVKHIGRALQWGALHLDGQRRDKAISTLHRLAKKGQAEFGELLPVRPPPKD